VQMKSMWREVYPESRLQSGSKEASQLVQILKKMSNFKNYVSESYSELKNHVTWPTWAEGQKLMVIVAVFSILFSLAIWGVDEVFSAAVKQYFNWVKS